MQQQLSSASRPDEPGATEPAPRRVPRWAWALPLLVALALRLAVLPLGERLPHLGDSIHYVTLANHFLRTGGFLELEFGVRPPLLPMLVAVGLDDEGAAWPGVYVLQILCDLLAGALLVRLTLRVFRVRAALWAAWMYALFPTSILYASAVVMAESAALLATAIVLNLLVALEDALTEETPRRRRRLAIALGAVLGLGILTKELLLPAAIAVGVVLLSRGAAPFALRFRTALVTTLVALAIVSPWIAYNADRHGVLVITGTTGDLGLIVDNHPPEGSRTGHFKGGELWNQRKTLKGKVQLAREVFVGALTEWPLTTARRAWSRLRVALGPETLTTTRLAYELGEIEPEMTVGFAFTTAHWRLPPATWGRRVQLLAGLADVLVFALAAAGMVLASGGPLRRTALLLTALFLVTFMLTSADSRYRLVLLPYYLPFAGLAIARIFGRAADRDETTRPLRQRAERVGLAVGLGLTLTVLVLPPPPIV